MMNEDDFLKQYRKAQELPRNEPRAIKAHFDIELRAIVIVLNNGAIYQFPVEIAQGLKGADPKDLAEVEVTPVGDALHWEKLDADLSVVGLLNGRFGTEKWMKSLQNQRQY